MTTAADLCGRGFLPRELPPPFSSLSFGALAGRAWQPRVPQSSCVIHNLFRSGVLRRQLSIPNPLAFLALAREIEGRWTQLQPILGLSQWSLSRPVIAAGLAVEPRQQLKVTLLARVKNRAGKRYAVKADILRFYPSIYTHALEWAIHTKAAKPSQKVNFVKVFFTAFVKSLVVKVTRLIARKPVRAACQRGLDIWLVVP